MTTSTKAKDETDKGVTTVVFTVVIGFIVVFVLIIGGYQILADRLNALDAYRTMELMKQRDNLKADCEENFKTLSKAQEWLHQQTNLKPPLDIMTVKQCRPIQSVEKSDSKE